MKRKKQKLSVCMIVKNEERFLKECLQSVKKVADQIVVLDTGSTDNTVAIARQFGAEIYHYQWQDDFAAARNASIKYAKGDWILWLDADERLETDSVKQLQQLLKPETKPVAYLVTIKNLLPDGKHFKLSTGHRLFTNYKRLYFKGRVHEQLVYSLAQNKGEERLSKITLLHLGYALTKEEQRQKDLRNRQLLLKMVSEQPENAYAHYTLAQNYALSGDFEQALHHYFLALKKETFQPSLKRQLLNNISEAYLKTNQLKKAEQFAQQSLQLSSNQVGAYYLLYQIYWQQQDYSRAINWLQQLRQKNQAALQKQFHLENDILLDDKEIVLTLGEIYLRLVDIPRAKSYFMEVIAGEKTPLPVAKKIVHYCLQQNEPVLALAILKQMNGVADVEMLHVKGMLEIKQQNFVEAIQTFSQLLKLQPTNREVVRKLAGLFLKIGKQKEAEQILAALRAIPLQTS